MSQLTEAIQNGREELEDIVDPIYKEVEASFAENFHVTIRDFLSSYTLSLLAALREAGPGKKEIPKLKYNVLVYPYSAEGFNNCRSQYLTLLSQAEEEVRKGK
jgi:hypothetical protein